MDRLHTTPTTPPEKPTPEGYFLIPRSLVFGLIGLATYIALALTVLAIGVWSGLGTDSSQSSELRTLALQNRRALCGLRDDLHQRVTGSEQFLQIHPEGLPGLGVSSAAIRETIANQRRTIHALGVLNCHPLKPDSGS